MLCDLSKGVKSEALIFPDRFVHADTVEAAAFNDGAVRLDIPQLFIKADGFKAALDHDPCVAEVGDPSLGFFNSSASEALPAILRQDDDAP